MTKRKHQRYDLEFKRQAEALASHPDIMTQDVARIMDTISFYNTKRRLSSLGYQSPVDYEKLAA